MLHTDGHRWMADQLLNVFWLDAAMLQGAQVAYGALPSMLLMIRCRVLRDICREECKLDGSSLADQNSRRPGT